MAFADPPPRLHLDTLLAPRRSLSKRGFAIMMSGVVAYNLLVAGFLVLIGAYPVPIFLGLDVLALFIAFRVSYARAGSGERVQVTADEVRVSYRRGRQEQTVWTSPTAFTRVQVEREGEPDAEVRLRLSGRALRLGAALSPRERAAFATALEQAIQSARRERYA